MFTNWLTNSTNSELNNTNLTTATTSILTNPPDVILELGPAPETVRFMAHSVVLSMHSGYLRSALRVDEQQLNNGNNNVNNNLIVYLTNVTAEQFAPLLAYMYTGYLDLTVENIFGVLLATHVLHMPRALEICRAFLARAQTEGYLTNLIPNNAVINHGAGKIIRPIPSKPSVYGFLEAVTNNGTLQDTSVSAATTAYKSVTMEECLNETTTTTSQSGEEIDVDNSSSRGSEQETTTAAGVEDVEVFIDGNTTTDVEDYAQLKANNANIAKTSLEHKPLKSITRNTNKRSCKKLTTTKELHKKRAHKSQTSLGLQIAKAPIPASQLEPTEGTKVIIDIASCDGPVRFRRILNTAYGHKTDAYVVAPERTQQSVSLSFQQQMARTIRQQTEETENKDAAATAKTNKTLNTEIYVCVYCKHTFKSQYCYQKHAKRHLNPLTMSCARTTDLNEKKPAKIHEKTMPTNDLELQPLTKSSDTVELLRREVRPLDMNVQYYPCKTCGSKFPSYYFVHKHRKLCHPEEHNSSTGGVSGTEMAQLEQHETQEEDAT